LLWLYRDKWHSRWTKVALATVGILVSLSPFPSPSGPQPPLLGKWVNPEYGADEMSFEFHGDGTFVIVGKVGTADQSERIEGDWRTPSDGFLEIDYRDQQGYKRAQYIVQGDRFSFRLPGNNSVNFVRASYSPPATAGAEATDTIRLIIGQWRVGIWEIAPGNIMTLDEQYDQNGEWASWGFGCKWENRWRGRWRMLQNGNLETVDHNNARREYSISFEGNVLIRRDAANLFRNTEARLVSLSHPPSYFQHAGSFIIPPPPADGAIVANPPTTSDQELDAWGFSNAQYEAVLKNAVQRMPNIPAAPSVEILYRKPTLISNTTFDADGRFAEAIASFSQSNGRPKLFVMCGNTRYIMILTMNDFVVGYYDSELDEYIMMEDDRPTVSAFGDSIDVTESN